MPAEFKYNPQPFDGSQRPIPDAEKKAVTARLTGGVNELFTKHIDEIDEQTLVNGKLTQYLGLELASDETLVFEVKRQLDIPKDTYTDPVIIVSKKFQGVLADGYIQKEYQYTTDQSDVVRRFDAHIGRFDFPCVQNGQTESDIINNEERNYRLEESMGFKNQPVGLGEINEVLTLAEQAEPQGVTFRELQSMHGMSGSDDNPHETTPQELSYFKQVVDDHLQTHENNGVVYRDGNTGITTQEVGWSNDTNFFVIVRKKIPLDSETKREVVILHKDSYESAGLMYQEGETGSLMSNHVVMSDGDSEKHQTIAPMRLADTKRLRRFLKKPRIGD